MQDNNEEYTLISGIDECNRNEHEEAEEAFLEDYCTYTINDCVYAYTDEVKGYYVLNGKKYSTYKTIKKILKNGLFTTSLDIRI